MRTLAGSLARLVVEWIVQVAVGVAGTYGVVAVVLGMLQRKLIFTRPSRVKRAELGAAAGTYLVRKSFVQARDGAKLEVTESLAAASPRGRSFTSVGAARTRLGRSTSRLMRQDGALSRRTTEDLGFRRARRASVRSRQMPWSCLTRSGSEASESSSQAAASAAAWPST